MMIHLIEITYQKIMSKQIAYVVTDSGIDGREPTRVLYAAFDEKERDVLLVEDKSKAWRSTSEQIVDVAAAQAKALAKLDGIDRLVLGLPAWPARMPSLKGAA